MQYTQSQFVETSLHNPQIPHSETRKLVNLHKSSRFILDIPPEKRQKSARFRFRAFLKVCETFHTISDGFQRIQAALQSICRGRRPRRPAPRSLHYICRGRRPRRPAWDVFPALQNVRTTSIAGADAHGAPRGTSSRHCRTSGRRALHGRGSILLSFIFNLLSLKL